MNKLKLEANWQGNMTFSGLTQSGHEFIMDASEEAGGENRGPRPTEMLLSAVVGCTGIDIISILEKMRHTPTDLKIEAKGERATSHPKRLTEIHIHYKFTGDLPDDKVFRAVELSLNKYCSVAYSLNANVTGSYTINEGERKILDPEMGGI